MADATALSRSKSPARSYRWILLASGVVLLGAMAFDTTIVKIGSDRDVQVQKFSPEAFGAEQFPVVRQSVETRAVDAVELSKAIVADKKTAVETYGVATSAGPVIPVKFTGLVGERKANYNVVAVEGLPPELTVRVQTGPALNGTDLRDATARSNSASSRTRSNIRTLAPPSTTRSRKSFLPGSIRQA